MGIKMQSAAGAVMGRMQEAGRILEEEIRLAFAYLGEECVRRIKDRSAEESWIDHTGNLRSSIAYAIYRHGRQQLQSALSGTGAEGKAAAAALLDSLSGVYADTFALVVVAGMSYAEYVEAIEGKDVLASAELWARGQADGVLRKAKEKAARRIRRLKE